MPEVADAVTTGSVKHRLLHDVHRVTREQGDPALGGTTPRSPAGPNQPIRYAVNVRPTLRPRGKRLVVQVDGCASRGRRLVQLNRCRHRALR
jgi:hypothetical protein